jgi:hypothetical protein
MVFDNRGIPKFATDFITDMLATASFLLANRLAFKCFFNLAPTLDFSNLQSASASLLHCYFALGARAFVATSRTYMSAF